MYCDDCDAPLMLDNFNELVCLCNYEYKKLEDEINELEVLLEASKNGDVRDLLRKRKNTLKNKKELLKRKLKHKKRIS